MFLKSVMSCFASKFYQPDSIDKFHRLMPCFQNQLFRRYASRPFFKVVMICDDMSTNTERFVKTKGLPFLLTHSPNVEEA